MVVPGSALNRESVTPPNTSSTVLLWRSMTVPRPSTRSSAFCAGCSSYWRRPCHRSRQGPAAGAARVGDADRASVPVASAVRISTCSDAEIDTMLAVTPVASAPAFDRVDASRRSSRLSARSTVTVRPLITKVPLGPSGSSSPPAMPSLAILCAAATCWTSMVWLAAWRRLVTVTPTDVRGAGGRRLSARLVVAKARLAWKMSLERVEARHAAQLVERALRAGECAADPGTRRSSPGCRRCAARSGRSGCAGPRSARRPPSADRSRPLLIEVRLSKLRLVVISLGSRSGALRRPATCACVAWQLQQLFGRICSITSPVVACRAQHHAPGRWRLGRC